MKKCQSCGFNNTDIMNFCLECGTALIKEPQMVVPLDSLSGQEAEKTSEQVTENYEKETVVGNRFAIQQSVPTYQQQTPKKSSNAKIFLAIGSLLLGLMFLIGGGAVGILIYALQSEGSSKPNRPLVSKTPIDEPEFPTPTPEVYETPEPTPKVKKTPRPEKTPLPKEEPITFPTPKVPTKRATFRVKNVSGWQLSNIKTVPLENFEVRVSGRIKLDGIKRKISARGISGYKNRRILKQYPTGAVLMRTHYPDGRHSNIQPVSAGTFWQNYKDETGKIEFIINDKFADDADGEFKVRFKMINVPKNER